MKKRRKMNHGVHGIETIARHESIEAALGQ